MVTPATLANTGARLSFPSRPVRQCITTCIQLTPQWRLKQREAIHPEPDRMCHLAYRKPYSSSEQLANSHQAVRALSHVMGLRTFPLERVFQEQVTLIGIYKLGIYRP